MDDELARNKLELEEMQKSWEEKVKEMEAEQEAQRKAQQVGKYCCNLYLTLNYFGRDRMY